LPYLAPRFARPLFILNAVIAWCAVALSAALNLSGYYVTKLDPARPTILGNLAEGIDTPLKRFFDWITYFTIWSNATVAIVLTVLAARPDLFLRRDRVGAIWRTLRLDSVLMITVTGLVYNLLLAEGGKEGLDSLSNALLHVVNPIATVAIWVLAGPRGLISIRTVFAALILPLTWAAFALLRGALVLAYPYPFLDVISNGWGSVLGFIAQVIVLGIVLSFGYLGLDAVIRRVWFGRAPG
jgi:hypothetical protein